MVLHNPNTCDPTIKEAEAGHKFEGSLGYKPENYVYACFANVCLHASVPGACGSQRALDPLELELQVKQPCVCLGWNPDPLQVYYRRRVTVSSQPITVLVNTGL